MPKFIGITCLVAIFAVEAWLLYDYLWVNCTLTAGEYFWLRWKWFSVLIGIVVFCHGVSAYRITVRQNEERRMK